MSDSITQYLTGVALFVLLGISFARLLQSEWAFCFTYVAVVILSLADAMLPGPPRAIGGSLWSNDLPIEIQS